MPLKSPRRIVAILLGSLALLLTLPVADYVLSPRGDWLEPLGFATWTAVPPVAWPFALGVAIAFGAFTARRVPAVRESWREVSWLKAIALWAAAAAAVVEEAFFRRIVMDFVSEAGGNALVQIVASALAFGAAHLVWGLIRLDLRIALSSATATTAMGFGLAVVYMASDRNLAPCIVGHFLITAIVEPGLMIAAVTGRWDGRAERASAARVTDRGEAKSS